MAETVETVRWFVITDCVHRAEATVLMRALRADVIGCFVQTIEIAALLLLLVNNDSRINRLAGARDYLEIELVPHRFPQHKMHIAIKRFLC